MLDTRCSDRISQQRQRSAAASSVNHQPSATVSKHVGLSHSPGRAVSTREQGNLWRSPGRAVLGVFLPHRTHSSFRLPKNTKGGNPRGEPLQCISPRHEAGRRRAIGGVAAAPLTLRATPPMVRRSGASDPEATQKAGAPENSFHQPPFRREDPHDLQVRYPTASSALQMRVGRRA
jgi:hypothetical protein